MLAMVKKLADMTAEELAAEKAFLDNQDAEEQNRRAKKKNRN